MLYNKLSPKLSGLKHLVFLPLSVSQEKVSSVVSYAVALKVSVGAISSEGMTIHFQSGWLTHGWQLGLVVGRQPHFLSTGLCDHHHNMVAGLPQSEQVQKPRQMRQGLRTAQQSHRPLFLQFPIDQFLLITLGSVLIAYSQLKEDTQGSDY